jgi:isopenicillin N synthase-like dioxygenase
MNQALPSRIDPVSFAGFERDFSGFSRALGESFARFGFAVISDHGLPQGRIEAALDAARAFFARPDEVKRRYQVGRAGQRGYTPFGVETAKGHAHHDLKEFWHVGRDLPPGHRFSAQMPPNVWPDADAPGFHEAVGWLFAALDAMGLKVLEAIAAWLGLDRGVFAPAVQDGRVRIS